MNSIRAKLFVIFSTSILLIVLVNILLNNIFMEKYYVYKNLDIFNSVYDEILEENKNNKDNKDNLDVFINEIDKNEGITVLIVDYNNAIIFSSNGDKSKNKRLPAEMENILNAPSFSVENKEYYGIIERENGQSPKIVYINKLDDNNNVILTKQLKGIRESVAINNQFNLLSGLGALLIGSILVFYISGKITKPIIQMNKTAKNISELDFSHRVEVNSNDELGQLADSINLIAEKLDDSIKELKADIDKRKQLVRNLSHEMKTPIAIVKGYTEGLKFGVVDSKEDIDIYFDTIVQECNNMDMMIKELIQLSQMEYSNTALELSDFNLNSLVNEVYEKLYKIYNNSDVSFENLVPDNLTIEADKKLIERVLINLISNAIKYTTGEKKIKVYIENAEKITKIIVFNSSNPIDDDELEKIWDVFYKIDKMRTRTEAGTGIGLSIVREIANKHGGYACAKNTIDGVEFIFAFTVK